jgi:hypothetical protein
MHAVKLCVGPDHTSSGETGSYECRHFADAMLGSDLVHALGIGIDPTSFERVQSRKVLRTVRVRHEQIK